ncbi:MAG: HAMP domain-containing histidine kinase [Cyanobacteria bacterium]|nr:HAMP domain-containing histidine kinase [Cyanobacteriota bacterium]
MKLVTRGYLFVGIPLAVQIIITSTLFATTRNLEKAVSREAFAKEVLSSAGQIQQLTAEAAVSIFSIGYSDAKNVRHSVDKVLTKYNGLVASLRTLKKRAPESGAKSIEEFIQASHHVAELLVDASGVRSEKSDVLAYSTVLGENEFNFELIMTMRKTTQAWQSLYEQFSSMAKEATPTGIKQQEHIRLLLLCALSINVVIAVALATYFGRLVVDRLNVLMQNIREFSKGRTELRTVAGNDEISLLDETFRSMARERWIAEQARQLAEQERRAILQMVSHDVKSPITAVNLTLDGIIKGYSTLSTDLILERLNRVSRETVRLLELCSTFLDLESFEDGHLELYQDDVSINALLERSRDAIVGMGERKNINIEIQCDKNDSIFCDKARITQVLVNLLANAIKFSPPDSVIELIGESHREFVLLAVKDHGPGIAEKDRKVMFEKFTQLSNARGKGGSGLGLWISSRLVSLHGAEIGCDSEEGKGTKFWLKFPKDIDVSGDVEDDNSDSTETT